MRRVPSRHGMHLPQLSRWMKSMKNFATSTMQCPFVHHDQAARAHHRADRLERLVVDVDVEVRGRGCSRPTARRSARPCRPCRRGCRRRCRRRSGAASCPWRLRRGRCAPPCPTARRPSCPCSTAVPTDENHSAPCSHDPRHVGQRLDVVDDRRLAEQAADGRERRPRPRHAAAPLDAVDQRRFLAAHERAGALLDDDLEAEAGVEDVLPEQAVRLRLRDGGGQRRDGQRVLGADVDVRLARADRVGRDAPGLRAGGAGRPRSPRGP